MVIYMSEGEKFKYVLITVGAGLMVASLDPMLMQGEHPGIRV